MSKVADTPDTLSIDMKTDTNITVEDTSTENKRVALPTQSKGRFSKPRSDIQKSAHELIGRSSLHGYSKIFGVYKHLIQRLVCAILALLSYLLFWLHCQKCPRTLRVSCHRKHQSSVRKRV